MAAFTNDSKNPMLTTLGEEASGGNLIIQDAGDVELADLVLDAVGGNCFALPISGGVATFDDMTDEASTTAGTASKFEIRASDTTVLMTGTVTVTGGGGDLTMASVTIGAGGTLADSTITVGM